MQRFQKLTGVLSMIGFLLVSCYAPPNSVNIGNNKTLSVAPVSADSKASSASSSPTVVYLASQATLHPLSPVSASEQVELEKRLLDHANAPSEPFTVQTFGRFQTFVARFVTRSPRGAYQIKIPETGSFELHLESGSNYSILDADASDGQARIQLPTGTLDTLLHLQGQWRQSSTLRVLDPLYSINETLTSPSKKLFDLDRWHRLGKRPLPIPQDWQNTSGQTFVLRFETTDVNEFQMLWTTTSQTASFPPGINQIDANGGTVELPGVGRLELPAGAVSEPTTIVLKERLESPIFQTLSLNGNGASSDFVSAVVDLFPQNLTLAQPGRLFLELDTTRLGNNDPVVMDWVRHKGDEEWALYAPHLLAPPLSSMGTDGVELESLSTIARVMPSHMTSNDGYHVLDPDEFSVQQVQIRDGCNGVNPSSGQDESYFLFLVPSGRDASDALKEVNKLCEFAIPVFNYYDGLIQQAGGKSLLKWKDYRGRPYYPITLVEDEESDQTNFSVWGYLTGASQFTMGFLNSGRETFAHELWHAFQYAQTNFLGIGSFVATNPLGYDWVIEGPAVHMGGKALLLFDGSKPTVYEAQANKNVEEIGLNLEFRPRGNSTGTFFTHAVNNTGGEIVLARLATSTGIWTGLNKIQALNQAFGKSVTELYKDFGFAVEETNQFLTATYIPDIAAENKISLSLEHTRENPYVLSREVGPLATLYKLIDLAQDLKDEKRSITLLIKQTGVNSTSNAEAIIENKRATFNRQIMGRHKLSEEYIEIKDFGKEGSAEQAVLFVSNGLDVDAFNNFSSDDSYTIYLALEAEDKSRVQVSTSSEYSIGNLSSLNSESVAIDPVTVTLQIKDAVGEPANGYYYIGLEKTFGYFRVMSPSVGNWNSQGTYALVQDGEVVLEYQARFIPRNSGNHSCGSSTCKVASTRFKVSGCDYFYYGKQRCGIIGPGKDFYHDGEESDEGRIYSTWIQSWNAPQDKNLFADGQVHTFEISGLRDSAGRAVKAGALYLEQPYRAFVSPVGSTTGSGVYQWIGIQDGTASFDFHTPDAPCWPSVDGVAKDGVYFDDSRYAENWPGATMIINYQKQVCD